MSESALPPEADATPDEAFDLGRISGYDEAMEEVRARFAQLQPTWHRGMYGAPDDMFSRIALIRWLEGV